MSQTRRRRVQRAVAVLTVMALVPLALIFEATFAPPVSASRYADYKTWIGGALAPCGYWRLGESSGSVAHEYNNQINRDGTYHNITLGRPGAIYNDSNTAAGFNGSSSYVTLDTDCNNADTYAFQTWVRTGGTVSGEQYIMSKQDPSSSGTDGEIVLGILNHRAEFFGNGVNNEWGFSTSGKGPKIDDQKWHLLVGYADQLWVDGVLVSSGPIAVVGAIDAPIYLGVNARDNTNFFSGDMDEADYLTYSLDNPEILAHNGLYYAGYPSGGEFGLLSASMQNHGAHACHADPVDTATGSFTETFQDLATPGRGLPLSVTRTYNSQLANTDGSFGYGWSFPYGMSFTQSSSDAAITEENGSEVTFYRSGSNYTPTAPRFAASLTDNLDGTVTFTRLGRAFYTFNASTGQLLSEQDLNGKNASTPYATSFSYTSGKLTTATDPAGRTYTFGWTGNHITSLTDSSSPARTVTYAYDGSGNLTDVYGVNTTRSPSLLNDDHTVFTYDSSHRMLTRRDPKFYGSSITPTPVTTNVYDSSSRVISQTDPLGRETTFDYSTVPGSVIVTDPKGNEVLDTYWAGLLHACTVGYGTSSAATTQYSYDPDTLGIAETTDHNGHLWTATFDSAGNKLTSTDPLNRTTTYTYNGYNEVTSITEPKTFGGVHASTTFGYDESGHASAGAGNLTSKSSPLINGSGSTTATQVTYFNHSSSTHPGDVTSVVDPDSNTTTFAYDSYGNLTAQTAPATPENGSGNQTQYGYDTTKGWLTSTVSPRGVIASVTTSCTPPALGCTTFAHDAWGHVTTTTDPLGHTTVAHHDANGNQDSTTDANNNTTGYTFDAANQLTTVTRADTTTLANDYYDDGRLHRWRMTECAKYRWERKERSRCACCPSISPIGSRTPCCRRCWRPRHDPDHGKRRPQCDPAISGCGRERGRYRHRCPASCRHPRRSRCSCRRRGSQGRRKTHRIQGVGARRDGRDRQRDASANGDRSWLVQRAPGKKMCLTQRRRGFENLSGITDV